MNSAPYYFSEALDIMIADGRFMRRISWPEGTCVGVKYSTRRRVYLQSMPKAKASTDRMQYALKNAPSDMTEAYVYIAFAGGKRCMPWLPTQDDLFARAWEYGVSPQKTGTSLFLPTPRQRPQTKEKI